MAPSIKVFLSHSSADKDLARRLARDLQSASIEVWLDQWEIQVGEAFAQTIEKGVEDATYVLVLLTPASVSSHWVDREWRQKFQTEAKTRRFSIVPVRGEPCEIPDFLAQRSYADISGGSYPLGFKYLLEILRYHSNGADLKIPASISASLDKTAADETAADEADDSSVPMLPLVTPISLEVGIGLIPLFEPDAQGHCYMMDELLPNMRNRLQGKMGFPFPGIRIRGNESDMPPYAALIMIEEVPELLFEAIPPTANNATWNAAEYIVQRLETLLQKMAAEFLTIDTACRLVKPFEDSHSNLVAKTVPKSISWYELTDVLRRLVEEDINIGNMARILAALSHYLSHTGGKVRDTVVLAEKARHALSAQITKKFLENREVLPAITLSAHIESLMHQALHQTSTGSYLALNPNTTQEILSAIRLALHTLSGRANNPIILADWTIRRYVRKLVELEFPWLQVLSRQDLEASCPLQILGVVQLGANQVAKTAQNLRAHEFVNGKGGANE